MVNLFSTIDFWLAISRRICAGIQSESLQSRATILLAHTATGYDKTSGRLLAEQVTSRDLAL
jgi:hypothetical protein